jgi:beta-lactam-binding protein with PASTA domain
MVGVACVILGVAILTGCSALEAAVVADIRSSLNASAPVPSGEVVIGDYTCQTFADARDQVELAGLHADPVTVEAGVDWQADWLVHAQAPFPGDSVDPGSSIALVLSPPTEPCP